MSEAIDINADIVVDTSGLTCPGPVVQAKNQSKALARGEVLMVVTDCPGAEADLRAWGEQTHREILAMEQIKEGKKAFYIRNGDPWKADVYLDMRGARCPVPVIELDKRLHNIDHGKTVKLVTDCNAARDEIETWARATGHELLGIVGGAEECHVAYVRN